MAMRLPQNFLYRPFSIPLKGMLSPRRNWQYRQPRDIAAFRNMLFYAAPFSSPSAQIEEAHEASNMSHESDPPSTDTSPQHAVVSTFDLLSIGIGPSSSHTVGPMRAGKIFVESLRDLELLHKVNSIKVALYGSLAATGKGHMSPQALLCGLEGEDPETVDTDTVNPRYEVIQKNKTLALGGTRSIDFDMSKDMIWYWDRVLPQHPNGMRFTVFDAEGDMLATNEYFSIGGGFVVNEVTQVSGGENVFYKAINKSDAQPSRTKLPVPDDAPCSSASPAYNPGISNGHAPPMPFHSGASLLQLTRDHNLTIAQVAWENERAHYSDFEIRSKLLNLYSVMDDCIRQGVSSTEEYLPGRLRVKRRARNLYKRLTRGFYDDERMLSSEEARYMIGASDKKSHKTLLSSPTSKVYLPPKSSRFVRGQFDHPIPPARPRRTVFSGMDMLSCYAIAVNEVNASGGRIVTAPTNGAAGVIPAVLKYFVEFISEDPERDVQTFLLTASAIGMLFKRGATISAAEGGCMAEVGVACSMAAAGFAACMGGSPEVVEQAAEIGIEHNLGLTCDPIDGLVQVPCIERNSLGAVKAVTAAQLALAGGDGSHSVSLDEAISAMKVTARDMLSHYKETSRSGLATSVRRGARISSAVPDC